MSMHRFSFFVVSFLFSLSAVYAQEERIDTAFLSEMDSIIAEYEEMERTRKVEQVIKVYDEKQL